MINDISYTDIRPRRSALYIPASNKYRLEKARNLACDIIIMDLEDAVSPTQKISARNNIIDVINAGGFNNREILVRVNDLSTIWGKGDVEIMASSGASGLVLPKVNNAIDIAHLDALMKDSGAAENMTIWAMIETPMGVLHAEEIAKSSQSLAGFIMGTNDLTADLHAVDSYDRQPLLTSLSICLLAARAYGLAILDGVHSNINDDDGFEKICQQGLEFGFDGKSLIHPKTIAVANKIFSPSDIDIKRAEEIIEASNFANENGNGVIALPDGQLVEELHARQAKKILKMGAMIAELKKDIGD